MSIDLTSIVLCRNLYIDYYYKGNKAGTSVDDIKLIEAQYENYLSKWQNIGQGVEKDTNEYVIDDNDWNSAYDDGKSSAKDETGYRASGWRNAGNGILTGTNAAISAAGGLAWAGVGQGIGNFSMNAGADISNEAGKMLGSKGVEGAGAAIGKALSGKTAKKLTDKATGEATENLATKADKGTDKFGNGAWVVAIPIEFASAILALATNQNGKEADALAELSGLMTESQGELYSAQAEMESAATEVAEKEQEVLDINEDSSTQMIELQTKSNMYYSSYMRLKAKMDKGEVLTAGEKALMKTFETNINNNNSTQTSLQATTEEMRTTAVGELGALTTTFDSAAETMANTQGMTDYGASFDKCTKVLCMVAMVSDGLNIIGAAKNGWKAGVFAASGTWAFGATAWAWAWVAMAAAAVVMSGIDAYRQYQHLQVTNEEIGVRETTEQVNEGVSGTYDTDITEFDASMQSLEEMEVLELQKKTVPTTSTSSGSGSGNSSNTASGNDDDSGGYTVGKIKTPKL